MLAYLHAFNKLVKYVCLLSTPFSVWLIWWWNHISNLVARLRRILQKAMQFFYRLTLEFSTSVVGRRYWCHFWRVFWSGFVEMSESKKNLTVKLFPAFSLRKCWIPTNNRIHQVKNRIIKDNKFHLRMRTFGNIFFRANAFV